MCNVNNKAKVSKMENCWNEFTIYPCLNWTLRIQIHELFSKFNDVFRSPTHSQNIFCYVNEFFDAICVQWRKAFQITVTGQNIFLVAETKPENQLNSFYSGTAIFTSSLSSWMFLGNVLRELSDLLPPLPKSSMKYFPPAPLLHMECSNNANEGNMSKRSWLLGLIICLYLL